MKANKTFSAGAGNEQDALIQDTVTRVRSQKIFEIIRERIGLLIYPPGIALRERELAEEFEVSRTPIRAVLQRLEFEGLTYSRQGHGTLVTSIDLNHLREIYQIRMKLAEMFGESATLENAPEVIEKLKSLLDDCDIVGDSSPNLEKFGQINIGLHLALQSLISNSTLRSQIDTLFFQTVRMWFLILSSKDWIYQLEELINEIRETMRFLKAGDLDSMGYIRRIHLSLVLRRLEELTEDDLVAT